jgi:hypothetical protein
MSNVLYVVEKHEMRKAADDYLMKHYPGTRSQLTSRLLKESLLYVEGFAKAIDYFAQDPIIVSDMRNLLISEGVDFIVKKIVK